MFCYSFSLFITFFYSFCKWKILYSLFKCAKKNQKKICLFHVLRARETERKCIHIQLALCHCRLVKWRKIHTTTLWPLPLEFVFIFIFSFSLHTKTPKKRNVHNTVEKFLQVFALFFPVFIWNVFLCFFSFLLKCESLNFSVKNWKMCSRVDVMSNKMCLN